MTKLEELATKKDLKTLEDKLTARLTAKIDANATKIDQVEKNLSAKIDANASKIEDNAAKIDANSKTLNRLTSLALENKVEIKKMAKQEDMDKRFDEIVSAIDGLARSFSILEQERVATTARVDGIEADVRQNKAKIQELEAKVAR